MSHFWVNWNVFDIVCTLLTGIVTSKFILRRISAWFVESWGSQLVWLLVLLVSQDDFGIFIDLIWLILTFVDGMIATMIAVLLWKIVGNVAKTDQMAGSLFGKVIFLCCFTDDVHVFVNVKGVAFWLSFNLVTFQLQFFVRIWGFSRLLIFQLGIGYIGRLLHWLYSSGLAVLVIERRWKLVLMS